MILLSLLLTAAPSSRPADDAITTYLQSCGHVEGPVRFKTVDGQGKDRQAFACTQKGKTRVAVFSALPSGQQGRQCDSAPVAGTASKLEHVRVAGVDLLRVRIVSPTPDEERVVEQALLVRWGACKAIAESNILHPLDGPTLREPMAGLDIDELGIDAWTDVARMRFGVDRRKVTVAIRGLRIEPQSNAAPVEIEAEPYEPVPLQTARRLNKGDAPVLIEGAVQTFAFGPGEKVTFAHERSFVRGVRVRVGGSFLWPLSVSVQGGPPVEWRADKHDWQSRAGVFGFGFLAQKGPTYSREAVVFFDPPVDAQEIELSLGSGKGEPISVESVRVLRDVKEWPAFEESEDFGERETY